MLLPLIVGSEKKNKGDSFERCVTCSLFYHQYFDVKIQIPKTLGHVCKTELYIKTECTILRL